MGFVAEAAVVTHLGVGLADWLAGWMYEGIARFLDWQMDGWIPRWLDGWIPGWFDGWMFR